MTSPGHIAFAPQLIQDFLEAFFHVFFLFSGEQEKNPYIVSVWDRENPFLEPCDANQ